MAFAPSERQAVSAYSHDKRGNLLNEFWALAELQELTRSNVWKGIGVDKGDNSPVVVVPGLLGSDTYLSPLNSWLMRMSYDVHASGISLPYILPKLHVERLKSKVKKIFEDTGRRVHLVGHSMGGAIARKTAHDIPQCVESVTGLTSPVDGHMFFKGEDLSRPLPERIRSTYIHSKDDGVLDWRTCLDPNPGATNVEIEGLTHVGAAWSSKAFEQIGQALRRASEGRILLFQSSSASRPAA